MPEAQAAKRVIAVLAGTAEQFRQWTFGRDAKMYQTAQRAEAEKWEGFFVNCPEKLIGMHYDEIVLLDGFDPELLENLIHYDVRVRPKYRKETLDRAD